MVPESRIVAVNEAPVRPGGDYVLYWMIAARRTAWNFGLDRALEHARELGLPLVVFEPLRAGHQWASVRIHQFVVQGMVDNATACEAAGVCYLPWVEPQHGDGKGMLARLASRASVVVTDHFPCFFLPAMVEAAGQALDVRLEAVDSNGIMPLATAPKVFTVAHAFRRHVQKNVYAHIDIRPVAEPLKGYDLGMATLPALDEWGRTDPAALLKSRFEGIDVPREPAPILMRGGPVAASYRMARFFEGGFSVYNEERNSVDKPVASGLSPYLHFGHISAHEIFATLEARENWTSDKLPPKATGKREGWWQMSGPAESFVDEFLTWREVGYTFCHLRPDRYATYDTLPEWALTTLEEHADDPRPHVYTYEQLENAETHDDIWNAAQRQLRAQGIIHNYLRMLWGKKVLHWSPSPQVAFERLEQLNNRWAIDGRNPNSYSGIAWTFGRFDRAWGPVRPIFGKIRYMTSDSTRRKLKLKGYLERWGRK